MFDFKKKKSVYLSQIVQGKRVGLDQVPDAMFSQKLIGDGYAVIPEWCDTLNKHEPMLIYAPIDGEIVQFFPTHHAFGIRSTEGLEVLVHIGIDTVMLKGEGFKPLACVGQNVHRGDSIVSVDFEYLKRSGKSTECIVVVTNMEIVKTLKIIDKSKANYAAVVELK